MITMITVGTFIIKMRQDGRPHRRRSDGQGMETMILGLLVRYMLQSRRSMLPALPPESRTSWRYCMISAPIRCLRCLSRFWAEICQFSRTIFSVNYSGTNIDKVPGCEAASRCDTPIYRPLTVRSRQMKKNRGHTSPTRNYHLNISIDKSLSMANNRSAMHTIHSAFHSHITRSTKAHLYKSHPAASADPLFGILALVESLLR